MGEKYAVLISGDLAENGYEEFWYDVVLMREALIDNDFPANHIFVLYGDGADYFNVNRPNPHYRPNPAITDLAATSANITAVFNGLANGTGGYPQMTEDDLLFVWTFDHGSGPNCIAGTRCRLGLRDPWPNDFIWDDDFATAVDQVPYAFRIFCMQQCHSGGFIDDLQNDQTVILTACGETEHAHPADAVECEIVNGVQYWHGEFNYHLLAALTGQSVTGVAVNADANGNGFVTMREVFDHIQANESQSETPEYDDGALNLGDKLHLSFADVYIRDNLQDSGAEPSTGASLCRSPDINHYRQALLDPQTTLGSAAAQSQDNLFEDVEEGQPNYIYARLQNRGYSATDVEIDIYWTPPSTLPTPSSWNFIGTLNMPSIAPDEFLVVGPLEWPVDQIPGSGHYCFVAILGNAQDPKPDTSMIGSTSDFYDFIRNNNNVVWKNFDVDDIFAGGYQQVEFQIQGWPRTACFSDLEIDLREIPVNAEVELRILKRLTVGTAAEGLSVVNETQLYSLFEGVAASPLALRNIPLQPSDNTEVRLAISWPEDVPAGAYELSILQKIDNQEMGRITKRVLIGDHPFVANRNTKEVHVANCEWVSRMNSGNKKAYHELDRALGHGYNGCKYCLPEFDTG